MKRTAIIIYFSVLPSQAFAYFDPGTGSLIIQALIGGLAAVTLFWGRVKLYVTSFFKSSASDDVAKQPDANAIGDEDTSPDA